ncbi:MAG: hypothetical protein ACOYOV_12335 [Bacteroidales bacterium]
MEEKEIDKKSFFWGADDETYNELQKLKKFVRFVSELKECSEEDKIKAGKIVDVIKNLNHAELISHFNVCLNLTDYTPPKYRKENPSIYLRNWTIWFECGFFEIEAASYYSNEPIEPFNGQYSYNSYVSFRKEHDSSNGFERIYINKDIDEFVNDALNYESYLTKDLDDVDVNIDIWE